MYGGTNRGVADSARSAAPRPLLTGPARPTSSTSSAILSVLGDWV